ncbi:hypothetical protein [Poritiphilus flavus]|nr:hypothetical protein [Poritiphilus flavus]
MYLYKALDFDPTEIAARAGGALDPDPKAKSLISEPETKNGGK